MHVELTRELEEFVRRRAASGLYASESEVVREALRLLERRDALRQFRHDELLREIDEGLADADAGRVVPFDEALIREVKENGRRALDQTNGRSQP